MMYKIKQHVWSFMWLRVCAVCIKTSGETVLRICKMTAGVFHTDTHKKWIISKYSAETRNVPVRASIVIICSKIHLKETLGCQYKLLKVLLAQNQYCLHKPHKFKSTNSSRPFNLAPSNRNNHPLMSALQLQGQRSRRESSACCYF